MFGDHARRREKNRDAKYLNKLRVERATNNSQKTAAAPAPLTIQEMANKQVGQMKTDRDADRIKGKARADEVLSRDVEGLTPQQKKDLESDGQRRLNRDMQGYDRQIVANQGRNGIKGGAAYAQRADLARIGQEAQGQYRRDLSKLDSDLKLKKLAAGFNIEEGEAAQGTLDRQMALDEQNLEQERKRQRMLEDQYNRLFSRV